LFHVLPAFLARGVAPAGETAIQKRDEQGHPTASNGIASSGAFAEISHLVLF
jgi:hypothetical protein